MVELYGGVLREGTAYIAISSSLRGERVCFDLEFTSERQLLFDKYLIREPDAA